MNGGIRESTIELRTGILQDERAEYYGTSMV
jgi:hypothetical protein